MPTAFVTPSLDGFARRTGVDETFGTIRGGSGNSHDDASAVNILTTLVSSGTSSQWAEITRGILLFDLAGVIPADHIVTGVTLSVFNVLSNDAFSQNMGITRATPASDAALADSDYDIANFGGTRLAGDQPLTGFGGTWTFNADGIAYVDAMAAANDKVRIGVRMSADIDNSPPTWAASSQSYIIIRYSEFGGNVPTLAIDHVAGSRGNPLFIFT